MGGDYGSISDLRSPFHTEKRWCPMSSAIVSAVKELPSHIMCALDHITWTIGVVIRVVIGVVIGVVIWGLLWGLIGVVIEG